MAKSVSKKTFSIEEALNFGWKEMKTYFLLFIFFLLSWVMLEFILGATESFLPRQDIWVPFGIVFARVILQSFLSLGALHIVLEITRKKKAKFSDIFDVAYLLPNYIGTVFLRGLIILGGFLLFIIPGIIWSVKFQYASYLVVDKNLGPMEALRKSSALTQGIKWQLFFFNIILMLVNLLGVLSFFIGLLVTIPVTMLAFAYVYRKVSSTK